MKIKFVLMLVVVICILASAFAGCTMVDTLDPMEPHNKEYADVSSTSGNT